MPIPKQYRPISAKHLDGREWRPRRKTASKLPPRAMLLVRLMVLGDPEKPLHGPLSLDEATAKMGVARDTGKKYLSIPAARSYFNSLCQELREGETPRNIWTAITIREDPEMAKTAAGNKVRLEAIRSIAQRDGPANVNVNLGIGVGVEITAGYQVTIPDDYAKAADKILAASGSTQRLGSDGNVIDVPNPRLPAPANPSP